MKVYCFLPFSAYPTTGIGRYAYQVGKRLDVRVFLYGAPFEGAVGNVSYVKDASFPFNRKYVSSLVYFPLRSLSFDADVYHAFTEGSAYPLLLARKRPLIVTYSDLIPWLYPQEMKGMMRMDVQLIKLVQRVSTRADFITAVSESTKNDLQHLLGVPSGKIRVIHLGVDRKFRVVSSKENAKKKLGIESPIVFSIARARGPNLETLLYAFHKLKKESQCGQNLRLYVSVSSLKTNASYMKAMSNLRETLCLEKDVRFVQTVTDERLIDLYNAADVFIFPSAYEGFGLPLLEAMACGTPVVACATSSAFEVVGDAGILINTSKTDDVAGAIHSILTNDELSENLKRKGLAKKIQLGKNDPRDTGII